MKNKSIILFAAILVFRFFTSSISAQETQHQHHQQVPPEPIQEETMAGAVTLQELEQTALQKNPTLVQAGAAVKVAEGKKAQSNLYPNPVVGLQLEELSQRDPQGQTDEHFFFTVEQTILLGGKRGKAGTFYEGEKQVALQNAEMQRARVLNSVRILYYQILGIQKQIEVKGQLLKLAEEAVQTTRELFNVGSADRPDLLEAEIEMQSVQLGLLSTQNEQKNLWRQLAAVVGNPEMVAAQVEGSLVANLPDLDREQLLTSLLNESSQVKAAQLRLQSRKAAIPVVKAEWVPDLRLYGGVGYNYELLEVRGEPVGLEGFFGVGIPLPIFSRNQGAVAAASAEAESAEQEIERVKLELAANFSTVFTEYVNAKTIAERYRNEMLPRAREAYELYLSSFQQMRAAYPQVLIAQRNQYQLEVDNVKALTNQWIAALKIQGSLLSEGALDAPSMNVGELWNQE